jgi:DHA1 family multidrug resistance protein-like MFS transporter
VKDAGRWRVTFYTMLAVQAINTSSFSTSVPFLPLYIQQLGVHPLSAVETWSGIVQSIAYIIAAVFAPIWGTVADRFGRKAMVVRSSIFGGLASALMGLSGNVWQLAGARTLTGMFAGFSSAATALVASAVPATSLGFALGWMATAQMVGTLIGPLLGGAVADITHNYRTVFFVTAGGALIASVVAMIFVHENFERKPREEHQRGQGRTRLRAILRHPEVLPLLVVIMLSQWTTLALQPVVPLFIQDMVGPTPYLATLAGAAFAVIGIGDLVASPWLGKRSDVIGYRRILLICLCGAGLFTIPQAFVHNVWAFLALRFGVGLWLGGIIPTTNAWIGRLFPTEQRGSVYGLSYSASFIGMFLGPLSGGALAARFGFSSVFFVCGGLIIANAIWVGFGVRAPETDRDWS